MEAMISQEVDRNYDYFQRNLSKYIGEHRGEYALIRRKKILGFYDEPGAAAKAAAAKFPDEIYSIQEVTDAPIDLGLYSYAGN